MLMLSSLTFYQPITLIIMIMVIIVIMVIMMIIMIMVRWKLISVETAHDDQNDQVLSYCDAKKDENLTKSRIMSARGKGWDGTTLFVSHQAAQSAGQKCIARSVTVVQN